VHKINIKPLSVNEAWQGRRFKTSKYNAYIKEVLLTLPKKTYEIEKTHIFIEFGLSSKNADIDNPVKCFIDCLQKKYGFNDKSIYKMTVQKVDVKKGDEYIRFELKDLL